MGDARTDDEARVHALIARACLGTASDADLTANLRAYLEEAGVSNADVEAWVGSPPRLALYRRLIRNNLTGVTWKMLARTRARLNDLAAAPGMFDASFDAFLGEEGPRTHYLRDVPREFLAWATPRWRAHPDLPPWSVDFARHELIEFEVAAARGRATTPEVTEVALDRPLVLTEPLRCMRYDFAVHELPEEESDRRSPPQRPTTLLVHRDREQAVKFVELTPFAAALVARLIDGLALGDAVKRACEEIGTVASDAVVTELARLLSDLGERGIVLGGEP